MISLLVLSASLVFSAQAPSAQRVQTKDVMAMTEGCIGLGTPSVVCNPPKIPPLLRQSRALSEYPVQAGRKSKAGGPTAAKWVGNEPCSLVGMHRPCRRILHDGAEHWFQD